jgi:hypothetical protein
MPAQTVNFDRGQYQYILATSEDGEFSERVRELVDRGMEAEQNE